MPVLFANYTRTTQTHRVVTPECQCVSCDKTLVCRVIEDLNGEAVSRIFHATAVVDYTPCDEGLVEHGQLHGDRRWFHIPLESPRVAQCRLPLLWLEKGHCLVEDGGVEEVELIDGHETARERSEADKYL